MGSLEGLDLENPSHLCALLQFKSTRLGWDLIRVTAAVNKAQVVRAIVAYKMLLNPANKDIVVAKFMNDESFYKRVCAQYILQECIERTNHMIDQLDEKWDNHLIEASREAYHALMGTIEMNFDAALARETASLAPVLYWLESETDVDDLCSSILDTNGITPREQMIMAMLHCADPQPQEAMAHE